MKKPLFEKNDESFTYLYLRFNVTKALQMPLEDAQIKPQPGFSPMVHIDYEYANTVDLTKPVLFARIVLSDEVLPLLIDGHHRNYKGHKEGLQEIPAKILSVKDTLAIMECGVPSKLKQMKQQAKKLGLL